MNRLQANLCLICVTLCWSTEVIIFACIPNDVLPFATSFITSAIAVIILVASFFKRIKAEMKRNAKRILLRCVFLGIIKCGYDVLFLYGLNYFDVSTGAFTFSITVVVLPVILLTMKKRQSENMVIRTAGACRHSLCAGFSGFRQSDHRLDVNADRLYTPRCVYNQA